MSDGYALASEVTQSLAGLAGAARTADLGSKQVMSWDGTNLKWRNTTITAWPSNIPDTQVVELIGFTTLDKVPSWVPKGKTNIHVLLPATNGVATLDSSGNVTANVPVAKLTSGSAAAGLTPVADGKGGFTMQSPAAEGSAIMTAVSDTDLAV